MNRTDDKTINKNRVIPDSMNYARLRELGIEYIRRLSGRLWTDHNVHDPGITILEQLCYALTDLGYRTSFEMRDLLTPEGKSNFEMDQHFIPPHEILPSHPLTITDYRKLVLEKFDEVNNVFIHRSDRVLTYQDRVLHPNEVKAERESSLFSRRIKGYYDVSLLLKRGVDPRVIQEMKEKVRAFLNDHRNLCEMFMNVKVLIPVYVGICADIEIEASADHKTIMAKVNEVLSGHVCPEIKKYSLKQMLERGMSVEDIFQNRIVGPAFVDPDELEASAVKDRLHVSDVVNLLMSIDGIPSVRHFHFIISDQQSKLIHHTSLQDIELVNSATTYFCFQPSLSRVAITRGNFTYPVSNEEYENPSIRTIGAVEKNIPCEMAVPQGRYREIDRYISFQNEFPFLYHVGKEGIREDETPERQAQRKQLKAYLLFFDRILSDYLAQLYGIKDLYSWNLSRPVTYFRGKLSEEEIYDVNLLLSGTLEAESDFERKDRFLNHLISRFNDEFVDFFIDKFNYSPLRRIRNKSRFLNTYALISSNRTRARMPGGQGTALEARILSKLGVDPSSAGRELTPVYSHEESGTIVFQDNRSTPFLSTFGLHVVEHIELLPNLPALQEMHLAENEFLTLAKSPQSGEIVEDPYSMRITVVLPGWLDCSLDYQFRIFVESLIREEMPAHVKVKICWIDPFQMMNFEKALERYRKYASGYKNIYRQSLKNLIAELTSMRNIYPHIRLYNNENAVDQDSALLDFSNIYGSKTSDDRWKFSTEK